MGVLVKHKILVIDDEPLIRESIRTILEREGFEVLEAANGKEGLNQVEHIQSLDLIICDVIMPEMEGFETITQLRKKLSDVKIIAISGGGRAISHTVLGTAELLGAKAFLSKPFDRVEFVDTVKHVLALKI